MIHRYKISRLLHVQTFREITFFLNKYDLNYLNFYPLYFYFLSYNFFQS